jgi:hypothetical protein
MNDPHKFGTEFGSDNAPEHSAAIVSHHDSLPAKTVLDERDRLRGPDPKLEDDARLVPVVNAVNSEIATLLG